MESSVELTDASRAMRSPRSSRRARFHQIPSSSSTFHDDDRDDDDDEHSEEAMSFISSDSVVQRETYLDGDYYMYNSFFGFWKLACCMCIVLLISLLALFLPSMDSFSERWVSLREPAQLPVKYKCSSEDKGDDNEKDNNSIYKATVDKLSDNLEAFMDDYRNSSRHNDDDDNEGGDYWGDHSYQEVKDGIYAFKFKYFAPYLRDGDTIFECASGNGLNLYMTLEILKEVKGIEHLIVYGAEKDQEQAQISRAVFDQNPPAHARKGIICSDQNMTRMDSIPSDSFNLVFSTGINPDDDPLRFGLGEGVTADQYKTYYAELCEASDSDWKGTKLNDIARLRQKDWYGEWVAEMSRIAKPGAPIIVERISSSPWCEDYDDFGGIEKAWWTTAAESNQYRWHVDPTSVEIVEDGLFGRYNVFMRTKGKR